MSNSEVNHAAQKLSEPRVPSSGVAGVPNPADPPGLISAPIRSACDQSDAQGHFARSNRGGPGNPHARHCARMLELFRNAIADEEMYVLCRILFEKASTGDMSALKLIWQYKLGKPLPAPNPDTLDRDEWDHFQKDGMTIDEMKQILTRLPSHVGNAIASAALPDIAASVSRTLSERLRQSLPPEFWAQRQQAAKEAEQSQAAGGITVQPPAPSTVDPFWIPGDGAYPESAPNSSGPEPCATLQSTGSNGNSKRTRTGPAAADTNKNVTGSNGNSKSSGNGTATASTHKNVTGSNGNLEPGFPAQKSATADKSPTRSNGTGKHKQGRNAYQRQWMIPIANKCKSKVNGKKQKVHA